MPATPRHRATPAEQTLAEARRAVLVLAVAAAAAVGLAVAIVIGA